MAELTKQSFSSLNEHSTQQEVATSERNKALSSITGKSWDPYRLYVRIRHISTVVVFALSLSRVSFCLFVSVEPDR